MLLKSLELQGFKTFPDKTTLTFHGGITAVVGPNGSGKSNISDAMRWVLGEQSARTLRCSKMEDIIFNGTPARRALGFAEVTLNIDNSDRRLSVDSDSVSVTRRYYRSGESEYLINKASVRLRDVNELFMDTGLGRDGYSMIGQGKIDSIVAARSEDRREIFEEAAGISRFRYRKVESERRLDQAEENLVRLQDILSELESRVGPLKEQAEKAKQYLAMAGEKRKLEIGLWLDTLEKSGSVLHSQEDKILTAKAQYDAAENTVAQLEEQIESNFQDSNACTAQADEIRRKGASFEEEASHRDSEILVLKNDIAHHAETVKRIEGEIEQNRHSGSDLEREIEEKQNLIGQKQDYIKTRDTDFAASNARLHEIKSGMNDTEEKISGLTQKMAHAASEGTKAKMAAATASSFIAEIERRLAEIHTSCEEKNRQSQELKKQEEESAVNCRKWEEKCVALGNTVKGYELRLQARRTRLESAQKECDRLRLDREEHLRRAGILEDLERNLEGFSQSVKAVVKSAAHGELGGIHGPVSRLFRVPQRYAAAVETSLGAAMQNIVVATEQDAKRAIAYLKHNNAGRATFLPLTTIHARILQENGLENCSGFLGVASELCSFDEKYRDVIRSLLGRVAVAEDLDSAVEIARKYGYRFRIVTLDGQVVNTGGSLTGGSMARNSGLLSRASEIEKLRKQAQETGTKLEHAQAVFKASKEEASSAEAGLSAARGELAAAREDQIRADAEHRRILSDIQTAQASAETLEGEAQAAALRLENRKTELRLADEKSDEMERQNSAIQSELEKIGGGREELNRLCDSLAAQIRSLEMERLSAQKDIESLQASIVEMNGRRRGHTEQETALREQIDSVKQDSLSLNQRICALQEEAERLRQKAQNCSDQAEELNRKRMQIERRATELRSQEREKTGEKEKIGHDLALLEERRDNLQKEYDSIVAKLWEEYELTRREAEQEVGEKISDTGGARRRLNELKTRIRNLGAVNVSAVEEYREVSERYEYLKNQVEDVKKSRDELKQLIGSLTREMKSLFSERFAQITENFGQTFRDLFGGGTASLSLSDPEDELNSGIEISVQPPGKIVSHLESLSGGEKALVAIALYFAIMKVNPPPFCMLDEIEAALDDVNVSRFALYLRRMNRNTQFILITHRRGSMEEADMLYGVTMQDEGVSKLLQMPVSEIEDKMKIRA